MSCSGISRTSKSLFPLNPCSGNLCTIHHRSSPFQGLLWQMQEVQESKHLWSSALTYMHGHQSANSCMLVGSRAITQQHGWQLCSTCLTLRGKGQSLHFLFSPSGDFHRVSMGLVPSKISVPFPRMLENGCDLALDTDGWLCFHIKLSCRYKYDVVPVLGNANSPEWA